MSMSEDLFLFQDSKHFRELVLIQKLLKAVKLSQDSERRELGQKVPSALEVWIRRPWGHRHYDMEA